MRSFFASTKAELGSFRKGAIRLLPALANADPTGKLRFFMPISNELLEILVCPVCKAKVVLKEDGTGLKCVECKRVYPVRDDIPIMLVDEAKVEP
jgi:uncharacterized protein